MARPRPNDDPPTATGGGFGNTGESAEPATDDASAPKDEALLDEALKETFPASDPISPSSAAGASEAPPAGADTPPPAPSGEPIAFPTAASVAQDVDEVFAELQQGRGRERVSDANVQALIGKAQQAGDAALERLLRDWQSP